MVTTVELLADVLPDSDAEAAYRRLAGLTFTEPLGDGLTLHELVRKALWADLRRRDQDRERELRRRIVDHLYERARRGDLLLAIDMAHLIENPAIKWGFGWEGAAEYRIDDARPGDAEVIQEALVKRNFGAWWPLTQRFFDEAPERVAVARNRGDEVCGYTVCMTPQTAPAFAHADPLLGRWLAHAQAESELGEAVLWHDSIDLTGDRRGRVQAMLGVAGVLRSGASNPRFAYLPLNPENPDALRFAQTMGAQRIPELDLEFESHRIECHRIDYGPGGLLAAERAVVYAELGLTPPAAPERAIDVEAVREALRNFRNPHELARSSLATGNTPEERVESVRQLFAAAAERAFGDSENEKLLKRVLVHGVSRADREPRAGGARPVAQPGGLLPAAARRRRADRGVPGRAGQRLTRAEPAAQPVATGAGGSTDSSVGRGGGGGALPRRSARLQATTAATAWIASTTAAKLLGERGACSSRIGSAIATRPSGSRNQVRFSASMY